MIQEAVDFEDLMPAALEPYEVMCVDTRVYVCVCVCIYKDVEELLPTSSPMW